MIIDTDILFKILNSKLVECHNKLSGEGIVSDVLPIIQRQRYLRDLKTSLLNLETFACIEENTAK